MATGSYMTPIYSRSQSEVLGDHHNLDKTFFPLFHPVVLTCACVQKPTISVNHFLTTPLVAIVTKVYLFTNITALTSSELQTTPSVG
ncbi:hypothetical protein TNCV_786231 [Trichonephila clavipes]|nr:hypothetical protein TNCV_786231 [Trichonephila clavipes]